LLSIELYNSLFSYEIYELLGYLSICMIVSSCEFVIKIFIELINNIFVWAWDKGIVSFEVLLTYW